MPRITPWLWLSNDEAEEAVKFYTAVFPGSRVVRTTYHGAGGHAPEGTVATIEFELDGQPFTALNATSMPLKLNAGISFHLSCESQEEVDHYWESLLDGGEESHSGWLTDRYGVAWQIIPSVVTRLYADPDEEKAKRARKAVGRMWKIDIDAVERAVESA